jgi:hypothetical protein
MPKPIIAALLATLATLGTAAARADALRVLPGMMLCRSGEATTQPDHPGCWIAPGGQAIDRINPAGAWSQLVVRSTNGEETMTVYARKEDADRVAPETQRSDAGRVDAKN